MYREKATAVTEILISATKISATGMEIFPHEQTTKLVPVTEPARQYQKTLGTAGPFDGEIVSFLSAEVVKRLTNHLA